MKTKKMCFSFHSIALAVASFLHLVNVAASTGEQSSIHDRMYQSVNSSAACFRTMNGTHSFGCSSNLNGNVGVIQLVESQADLSWLVNGSGRGPYIAVFRPIMFQKSILTQLIGNKKVAGALLLSGPGDRPDKTSSFSHADTCPNRYSSLNGSCNPNAPWNEHGTALLLQDWGFPMFLIEDNATIKNITKCYKDFNLPLDDTQNYRSLCAVELKSHMFSAVNSRVCMHRNELMSSTSSFSPVKYCDPISGKNIIFPVQPLKNGDETANQSVIVVAARLDATSLFYGASPGSLSAVTSVVTLLYTAWLLNQLVPSCGAEGCKDGNVLFLILNGETYDYIGSSRIVYDMKHKAFPDSTHYLTTNHIKLFIELSQLKSQKDLFYHYRNSTNGDNVESFISNLKKRSSTGIDISPVDGSTYLPPASFQTFLKEDAHIPGFILTNDDMVFKNRFYESIFDDKDNLDYTYHHLLKGIAEGSVQYLIANLATSLAYALYDSITSGPKPSNASLKVSPNQVDELLNCYLENQNCSLWRSFVTPDVQLDPKPVALYVGVGRQANIATSFTTFTLVNFTGSPTNISSSSDCSKHNSDAESYKYYWMYGDDTNGRCVKTYVNITPATSPAFDISDYKWESGEFPTWTESVWSEFNVRMFLKPSRSHEILTLSMGVAVITLSLIIVRRLNNCAGTVFSSTPSSPGS